MIYGNKSKQITSSIPCDFVYSLIFTFQNYSGPFSKRYICLVCFKETKFLESIFPIFSCLVTIRKVSQRKVFSGQRKKLPFITGKCFPFLVKRKTLSDLYIKHISETLCQIPLSPCLFPKTEARRTICCLHFFPYPVFFCL